MKVIALKQGYFGKLRMPGDEFDAPEGAKASWFVPVQTAISAPPASQGSQVPDGLPAFLLPGGGAPQDDSGGVVPPPADSLKAPAEAPVSTEGAPLAPAPASSAEKPADDALSGGVDESESDDKARDSDAKPTAKPASKRTRAAPSATGSDLV